MHEQTRNEDKETTGETSKNVKQLVSLNVGIEQVVVNGHNAQNDKDGKHFCLWNDTDAAKSRDNRILEGLKEPITTPIMKKIIFAKQIV
jgi:hypothetical protein